jgi:hypothetical protein
MSSRSSTVLIWSCYFALGFANVARHEYGFGAIMVGLGVIWFTRGIKTSNLDDLSTTTLDLNSTPRPRSAFGAKRIFA